MSYRDKTAVLTKAALIVWAIAAVVAVTVGLALLFTLAGVEINFGLVIGALSAIGSLSAAAAAVWVALWSAARNRQENEMERHAAYEAQARLVLLEVELHNENPSAPFFCGACPQLRRAINSLCDLGIGGTREPSKVTLRV